MTSAAVAELDRVLGVAMVDEQLVYDEVSSDSARRVVTRGGRVVLHPEWM